MISEAEHPRDSMLRAQRLPHIWCPGCGIGIVLNSYLTAIKESGIPSEDTVLVSGIGCTARLPGYANYDSYHTTHGRSIAFATGMKIANPKLNISIISGDGDLFNIGGNHIIHAARRNIDLKIICVNNFNYGMTGGQHGSTTPTGAFTASTPFGNPEQSFNLPYVMKAMGASYVARWTVFHPRQLIRSISNSLKVKGLTFIEVLSTCPPNFGKDNGFKTALSQMEFYHQNCKVDNNADLQDATIDFSSGKPIIVGDFYKRTRPTFHDLEQKTIEEAEA